MTRQKWPPSLPFVSGSVPKQAHVDIPSALYEEEHAREGFFGRTSHLYRRHTPTNWTRIEGPHGPQAFATGGPFPEATVQPQVLLGNTDVQIAIWTPQHPMTSFFRNGDGDEVWFIHQGKGLLETDYGPMTYNAGDYIVLPRGTTYRFAPEGAKQHYLKIECTDEVTLPDRGPLGRHAFFDPGVIEYPQAQPSKTPPTHGSEWCIEIKRLGEISKYYYDFNPLDVEGWKGDLFPWKLNVADIRPIISPKFHLPPSVHTTFLAQNVVICTFAPRPTETGDPKAQRVPFFHRNVDYDEVIFYHAGDFFSRSGIEPGMMTFHPFGPHHGPHPKALQNQFTKDATNEYAVMIDTRRPLIPTPWAERLALAHYSQSWRTDEAGTPRR